MTLVVSGVLTCMCNWPVSEDEVLYQNYQEKALHNDSDEDAESREPKSDDRIVVQYKPIRTSWSQLSVVSPKQKHSAADVITLCTFICINTRKRVCTALGRGT